MLRIFVRTCSIIERLFWFEGSRDVQIQDVGERRLIDALFGKRYRDVVCVNFSYKEFVIIELEFIFFILIFRGEFFSCQGFKIVIKNSNDDDSESVG